MPNKTILVWFRLRTQIKLAVVALATNRNWRRNIVVITIILLLKNIIPRVPTASAAQCPLKSIVTNGSKEIKRTRTTK